MTHYHVFETTLGFAAIAWNDAGVTRFNLPGPRDTATNRLGGATPGRAAAEHRGDHRSGTAVLCRRAHRF